MKFLEFLTEEKARKAHLDHVEDHALAGEEGYHHSVGAIKAVHAKLKGEPDASKISLKYDGSPAIVFGYHPETGKFFVGTKSTFNKSPKVNYSPEDIARNHDDPALRAKLRTALEHLPKVAPSKGVYKGDYLYNEGSVHEDNTHYHFTPNTMMYSVKKTDDEGKKIRRAKMGMVVHTKFHGKDLGSMYPSPDVDHHNFAKHPDVHVVNPEVGFDKTFGDEELNNQFQKHMDGAEKGYLELHPDAFAATDAHSAHLKKYVGQTTRTGEQPSAPGFKKYMMDTHEAEAEALKTPGGKLKKKEQLLRHLEYIDGNHDHYQNVLNIHHSLTQAKNILLAGLADKSPYETSIDGEETKPEGFVVVHKGRASKLVDRTEFSKVNFKKHAKTSTK